MQLRGKTLLEDVNKNLSWKLRNRTDLKLIKVGKNIQNKDDKILVALHQKTELQTTELQTISSQVKLKLNSSL